MLLGCKTVDFPSDQEPLLNTAFYEDLPVERLRPFKREKFHLAFSEGRERAEYYMQNLTKIEEFFTDSADRSYRIALLSTIKKVR